MSPTLPLPSITVLKRMEKLEHGNIKYQDSGGGMKLLVVLSLGLTVIVIVVVGGVVDGDVFDSVGGCSHCCCC